MHGSALRLSIFIFNMLMLMLIILHIMNLVKKRNFPGDSPLARATRDSLERPHNDRALTRLQRSARRFCSLHDHAAEDQAEH